MENLVKKAALYIRVSTDAQVEEGYSVDAQKDMLKGYCVSKGIKEYEFYIDGGFTGSNIERPQMQMLVSDVNTGKISTVIVYKLDRLSRSQKDTLYLIEDVFNPQKVDFISINENMDTSTPIGRAMLGIMSAFAQLERETIRERTRMGMKERVKSGLWMGGGRIPFGYDYDRALGILVPNEYAAKVVQCFELYLKGYSMGKVAEILGLKQDKLVSNIISRRTYLGNIVYNGIEYDGQHKAIIDEETFERCQEMIRSRSVNRLTTSTYLLTGMIYCGKCGARMRYQRWGTSGEAKVYCYSQQTSKKYLIKDVNCDNMKLWAKEVEEAVIKDLFEFSLKVREQAITKKENFSVLELLLQQQALTINKLKKLYTVLSCSGDDEILMETIMEIKADLEKNKAQIKKEETKTGLSEKISRKKKTIEDLSTAWEFLSDIERQKSIRDIIERVTIKDSSIEVKYKF